MSRNVSAFRVGRVHAYLRGKIWYLCYHENGHRRRPRVGPDRIVARQLASQINAQIAVGAPAALSFEPLDIADLRDCWLQRHEQVLRSSVQTINRYRTATDHLLRFLNDVHPVRLASQFRSSHAEEFVRYLRTTRVAPNGHPKAKKRPLLDKGIRFILETCRAMFAYALKKRHLSPYAENPFTSLEIERLPVEDSKPVEIFSPDQERIFLEACDDWQFPIFLTLMLTGLRPGELTHLLLPDDLDLGKGILQVRNKSKLGWQVKTRNERVIPLMPLLVDILRLVLDGRNTGPVFRRRRFHTGTEPLLAGKDMVDLERELTARIERRAVAASCSLSRMEQLREARELWRDMGGIKTDRIRMEYMHLTRDINLKEFTAPKSLRHLFATCLQDANVDPLIRNELMGHAPGGSRGTGAGLGMTATYTHTRSQTRQKQLEGALQARPALAVAAQWLEKHAGS